MQIYTFRFLGIEYQGVTNAVLHIRYARYYKGRFFDERSESQNGHLVNPRNWVWNTLNQGNRIKGVRKQVTNRKFV